jgi:hypothetical protein
MLPELAGPTMGVKAVSDPVELMLKGRIWFEVVVA